MDDAGFDALARRAAASRRGLLGTVIAALLAAAGRAPTIEARTRKRDYGEPCRKKAPAAPASVSRTADAGAMGS